MSKKRKYFKGSGHLASLYQSVSTGKPEVVSQNDSSIQIAQNFGVSSTALSNDAIDDHKIIRKELLYVMVILISLYVCLGVILYFDNTTGFVSRFSHKVASLLIKT